MKKNSSNIFVTTTITLLSLAFAVISVIPIIGPSFVAYALGIKRYSYKNCGFSNIHALISMAIGELIFFIIISLILSGVIEFYKSGIFWYLIIISFISNYLLSVILYFWGVYRAKTRKNKAMV